jgi:hypothetical protein
MNRNKNAAKALESKMKQSGTSGSLSDLARLVTKKSQVVLKWVDDIKIEDKDRFMQVAASIPVISVDYNVKKMKTKTELPDDFMLDNENSFEVQLFIGCKQGDPSSKSFSTKTNRNKGLSWHLILSCDTTNETCPIHKNTILLYRRLELKGSTTVSSTQFKLQDSISSKLRIDILCDSISGLDVTIGNISIL